VHEASVNPRKKWKAKLRRNGALNFKYLLRAAKRTNQARIWHHLGTERRARPATVTKTLTLIRAQ